MTTVISKKTRNLIYLSSLFFILLILVLLEKVGFLSSYSLRSLDYFYQKKSVSNPDIIIVGIDDVSLSSIGRWPWSRDIVAKGINNILSGEPASVGIDIIYSEKSENANYDTALADVLSNKDNVVMAKYFSFDETTVGGNFSIRSESRPADIFKSKSAFINVMPDMDGILRRFLLYIDYNGEKNLSFPYEIYRTAYENLGKDAVSTDNIHKDRLNRVHIMYTGSPTNFTMDSNDTSYEDSLSAVEHIPFSYVLEGVIDPEYFKDKIVLVGATSMGIADDYYFTPLAHNTPMFGIEVHANVINQLIKQNFVNEIPKNHISIIMLIFGLMIIFISQKLQAKYHIISIPIMYLSLYFTIVILQKNSIIFPPFYVILTIGVIYFFVFLGRYILTLYEKSYMANTFGKYIEKNMLEQMMKGEFKEISLGGEKVNITVLFVDIRGFTSLSELISPEEVVSILNEYLTLATDCVFDTDGTLDKYIGDATMAFWNAPFPQKDHKLRAIKTALLMVERSSVLNKKLEEMFGRTIHFGIGINSGPAVIGNIGSPKRMDYTAIGDTVNTASRIEGQTKADQILIPKDLYEDVKDVVHCEFCKSVFLKGKVNEVHLYEVKYFKEDVHIENM